jgi:hypothetical protein
MTGRAGFPRRIRSSGHEIIGRVTSVGKDVKRFKSGDHVGVGCMVDSCQKCTACEQGHEQYCSEIATFTYNHVDRRDKMPTYGGYSEKIVVSDKFVLKIPDGLTERPSLADHNRRRFAWKVGKGAWRLSASRTGHMAEACECAGRRCRCYVQRAKRGRAVGPTMSCLYKQGQMASVQDVSI